MASKEKKTNKKTGRMTLVGGDRIGRVAMEGIRGSNATLVQADSVTQLETRDIQLTDKPGQPADVYIKRLEAGGPPLPPRTQSRQAPKASRRGRGTILVPELPWQRDKLN